MSLHPAPVAPALSKEPEDTLDTLIETSADCQVNILPPPPILNAEEERRVWRKIDKRLIPISTLLYLVSYLDRGSIGEPRDLNTYLYGN